MFDQSMMPTESQWTVTPDVFSKSQGLRSLPRGKKLLFRIKNRSGRCYAPVIAILACTLPLSMFVGTASASSPAVADGAPRAQRIQTVFGTIGEVKVALRTEEVRFLEYDDEPSFFSPLPHRSSISGTERKIRSFGLHRYYPSMVPIEAGQEALHKTEESVFIGVLANSYSGSSKEMATRLKNEILYPDKGYRYEKDRATQYGLEVYNLVYVGGKSSATRIEGTLRDKTIYYHTSSKDSADSYVECLNVPALKKPCTLRFISPDPMRAIITVKFPRTVLPDWLGVQVRTQQLLNGFRVNK